MKVKNTGIKALGKGKHSFHCNIITQHDKDSFIRAKRHIEDQVGIVDISAKQLLIYLCDFYIKTNGLE